MKDNDSNGDEKYGKVIDARTGIYFIRSLLRAIHTHGESQTKQAKALENAMAKIQKLLKKSDHSEEMKQQITSILQSVKSDTNTSEWLINLIKNSFTITFNKKILLDTLNQAPGAKGDCTGIRFYLCLRNKEPYECEGETEEQKKEQVLSLVTVGVDKEGNDFKFEYDPSKHKWNADEHTWENTPEVESASLTSEHGYTRGYRLFKPNPGKELYPYVLFRYAMPKMDGE